MFTEAHGNDAREVRQKKGIATKPEAGAQRKRCLSDIVPTYSSEKKPQVVLKAFCGKIGKKQKSIVHIAVGKHSLVIIWYRKAESLGRPIS